MDSRPAAPSSSGATDDGSRRPLPGAEELQAPSTAGLASVTPAARQHEATVICVTNQKGGVGKTTTTVSLGAALADDGNEVLLVDLDPQGNATTGLGLRVTQGAPSTYRVVVEQFPIEDATEPTAVRRLHIVPSSLDLAGAEIELVPQFSRENRLKSAIDTIRGEYDVILIDCPPSLGLLTVNALVSADQVLVPIQCEYYALEGLGQLLRTVEMVRSSLNPALELGGVLMTMYDARTNLSQQVVDEVRGHFGDLAFDSIIPRTVRLSEAPSYGQPITAFDATSRGARSYQRLAREVAERLGLAAPGPASALDALLGPMTSEDARESDEGVDPEEVGDGLPPQGLPPRMGQSPTSVQVNDQFSRPDEGDTPDDRPLGGIDAAVDGAGPDPIADGAASDGPVLDGEDPDRGDHADPAAADPAAADPAATDPAATDPAAAGADSEAAPGSSTGDGLRASGVAVSPADSSTDPAPHDPAPHDPARRDSGPRDRGPNDPASNDTERDGPLPPATPDTPQEAPPWQT